MTASTILRYFGYLSVTMIALAVAAGDATAQRPRLPERKGPDVRPPIKTPKIDPAVERAISLRSSRSSASRTASDQYHGLPYHGRIRRRRRPAMARPHVPTHRGERDDDATRRRRVGRGGALCTASGAQTLTHKRHEPRQSDSLRFVDEPAFRVRTRGRASPRTSRSIARSAIDRRH